MAFSFVPPNQALMMQGFLPAQPRFLQESVGTPRTAGLPMTHEQELQNILNRNALGPGLPIRSHVDQRGIDLRTRGRALRARLFDLMGGNPSANAMALLDLFAPEHSGRRQRLAEGLLSTSNTFRPILEDDGPRRTTNPVRR